MAGAEALTISAAEAMRTQVINLCFAVVALVGFAEVMGRLQGVTLQQHE